MNFNAIYELFQENIRSAGSRPSAGFGSLGAFAVEPVVGLDAGIRQLRVVGGVDLYWCRSSTSALVVVGESQAACDSVTLSISDGEFLIGRNGSDVHFSVGGASVTLSACGSVASTGDVYVSASGGSIAAGRSIRINGVEITGGGQAPNLGRVAVFVAQASAPATVTLGGSGDVVMNGVEQSTLELYLKGSGTLRARGHVDSLRVDLSGSGDVLIKELEAKNLECDLRGSGEIRAHATVSVRCRLIGSGDIVVSGDPAQRDTRIQGSGDVRFKVGEHQ
ncbi:GIN domain-containing protein [Aquimonas sp.]|jgi:hypothetical protein|uniref:GIN domain-containing protein n=1 Tax=Aquimonas sp. TaxID=1872588 RepID=UPI0037BF4E7E